ncbi:hypothetical protein [uncultured Paracoccus sp.]|uniref:hypothetical protein n=1 Tax=uncultured Paracoccus sp. TaxID=189685 RepID=UPI0025EE9740|nr:hypothetical protein [uncultured Paracoccus sp.]
MQTCATPQADDIRQDIFNQAELVADQLHTAVGCNRAVMALVDQLASEIPDHGHQLLAVITAVDRYLSEAVEDLDSLTRLTIG